MSLREIFNAVKKRLATATSFPQVDAFCGQSRAEILQTCAESGVCVCVSLDGAEISSANASYRIKPQSREINVYYVCTMERMADGRHLDDIEQIMGALHAFRIGNETLQPQRLKIVDRDGVVVYALGFSV